MYLEKLYTKEMYVKLEYIMHASVSIQYGCVTLHLFVQVDVDSVTPET